MSATPETRTDQELLSAMRADRQVKEDKDLEAMRQRGFRTRAAILVTVEQGAQKYANATGVDVHVWGVQGGYEARSVGRGEPSGSKTLMRTCTKQFASTGIAEDDDPLGKEPKPPTKVKPVNGSKLVKPDGA